MLGRYNFRRESFASSTAWRGAFVDATGGLRLVVKSLIPAVTLRERTQFSVEKPTIFELLEAATISAGEDKKNFVYIFERRGPLGLSITSLGVEHLKPVGPTLNLDTRARGIYQLTEIAIPAGVVAWQYYVYRKGISWSQLHPGAPTGASPTINKKVPAKGFTPFDKFEILAGDEIVWRQVAILRNPVLPPSPEAVS